MQTLASSLHIEGQTVVDIILGENGTSTYTKVRDVLKEQVEPELLKYLKELNIKETIAKVSSIELLEKVEVVYLTNEFKTLLANKIDEFEELSAGQKTWLYATYIQMFFNGSQAHINQIFMARARELTIPSRIIQPR